MLLDQFGTDLSLKSNSFYSSFFMILKNYSLDQQEAILPRTLPHSRVVFRSSRAPAWLGIDRINFRSSSGHSIPHDTVHVYPIRFYFAALSNHDPILTPSRSRIVSPIPRSHFLPRSERCLLEACAFPPSH